MESSGLSGDIHDKHILVILLSSVYLLLASCGIIKGEPDRRKEGEWEHGAKDLRLAVSLHESFNQCLYMWASPIRTRGGWHYTVHFTELGWLTSTRDLEIPIPRPNEWRDLFLFSVLHKDDRGGIFLLHYLFYIQIYDVQTNDQRLLKKRSWTDAHPVVQTHS